MNIAKRAPGTIGKTERRHTVRRKDGGTVELIVNPRKAIAVMCTECMGYGDPQECPGTLCPLYPFRRRTLAAY